MSIIGTITAANIVEVIIASIENWTSVVKYVECIQRLKKERSWGYGTRGHIGMDGAGTRAKRKRNSNLNDRNIGDV